MGAELTSYSEHVQLPVIPDKSDTVNIHHIQPDRLHSWNTKDSHLVELLYNLKVGDRIILVSMAEWCYYNKDIAVTQVIK